MLPQCCGFLVVQQLLDLPPKAYIIMCLQLNIKQDNLLLLGSYITQHLQPNFHKTGVRLESTSHCWVCFYSHFHLTSMRFVHSCTTFQTCWRIYVGWPVYAENGADELLHLGCMGNSLITSTLFLHAGSSNDPAIFTFTQAHWVFASAA